MNAHLRSNRTSVLAQPQQCAAALDTIIALSTKALDCLLSDALDDAYVLGEKRDRSIRQAFEQYPAKTLQQFPRQLDELRRLDASLMRVLAEKHAQLQDQAQTARKQRAATRAYAGASRYGLQST